MELKPSPIILNKLDCLIDHFFNSTRLNSWKFTQMSSVLRNQVLSTTEEELVFKCLLYIYENLICYAFKYDVSKCVALLKFTLENNKSSRIRYRRVRLLESIQKGYVLKDADIINLLLEQIEKLIDYILNRMYPDESKNQKSVPIGIKGHAWTKLEKPTLLENPFKDQIPNYGG